MRLSAEAAAVGGYCKALMGNHELLLLGAKRFGDTPVHSGAGTATFQAAWLLNGGQKTDMDRLQDHHLQWMARLDAMERVDGHLLVHSDTTAYLDYGDSIEAVNDTIRETLTRNDADECWNIFRKFTRRFAFRDEGGAEAALSLLDTYGGTRVVAGHSPIPYLLGEVGSEDGEDAAGPVVEGPHLYADGLAIAMDGGVTMAGNCWSSNFPWIAEGSSGRRPPGRTALARGQFLETPCHGVPSPLYHRLIRSRLPSVSARRLVSVRATSPTEHRGMHMNSVPQHLLSEDHQIERILDEALRSAPRRRNSPLSAGG